MIYLEFDEMDPGFCFGLEEMLVEDLAAAATSDDEVADGSAADETYFLLWHTVPTLMLGRFQSPQVEMDLAYAAAQGIHLVRRPSGGGTIYTDPGSWQFSYIRRAAQGKKEIDFAPFVEPIQAALRDLGFPVGQSGRNDLLADGRKCSGNAQYFSKGFQVHHGSILFDTNIEQMVRSLTVDEEKYRTKGIESVRQRVVNLRDYRPDLDTLQFRDLLLEKILANAASAAGEPVQKRALIAKEEARIRRDLAPRFGSHEWVFGKAPAYDFRKKTKLGGGLVDVSLTVKQDKISAISILGDFFFAGALEDVEAKLVNVDYTKEAVRAALAGVNVYLIEEEEFVDCFF